MHLPVRGDVVGPGGAVLGDVQRARPVLGGHADQDLLQAGRPDLPAQHGLRHAVGRRLARVRDTAARVVADDGGGVVVDALPVQRGGDRFGVAGLLGEGDAVDLPHVGREAAAVDRVQPPPVHMPVVTRRRLDVLAAVGGGLAGVHHVDDADPGVRYGGPQSLRGQAVREQQMVGHGHGDIDVSQAGRVPPLEVPDPRGAARLVQRAPVLDPVPEQAGHRRGVVGEAGGGLPRRPAAPVLQRLRQVPVVQRRERGDARPQQRVHQAVVVREAGLVDRPGAVGHDPRPGDREAVGVDAELFHDPEVFGPPVVVIAGDVPRVPAGHLAGGMGEGVPDRGGPAVFADRSFDLVGRGRYAPGEASR